MYKFIIKGFFLITIITIISCSSPNPHDALIIGQWNKVSWTIDNTDETINRTMNFQFNDDQSYEIDYGSQKENGVFNIEGERLYTIEEGQARKYVKIIKMTKDSFIFKMNRAGRMETVVLAK